MISLMFSSVLITRFILYVEKHIAIMFKLEPYFHDPAPLIECLCGVDNIITDIVGIHYFEEDSLGLYYQVYLSNNRDIVVWEPTWKLTNIRDGLLLWKNHMLTYVYSCSLCPLHLHPEHQLNVGYVCAMNTCDQCDKTNLPYPSWTDTHVNKYEHCTRKIIHKIYCMCTYPKVYRNVDHYLVSWEAPYEDSHCWLSCGQLWGSIMCDGMWKIEDWSCSFCCCSYMLHMLHDASIKQKFIETKVVYL